MFAIDFECIERLVASGVPRRLECSQRSILKPSQKRAGVIDSDLFRFSGQVVFPLLDECLSHCRDGIYFAI